MINGSARPLWCVTLTGRLQGYGGGNTRVKYIQSTITRLTDWGKFRQVCWNLKIDDVALKLRERTISSHCLGYRVINKSPLLWVKGVRGFN